MSPQSNENVITRDLQFGDSLGSCLRQGQLSRALISAVDEGSTVVDQLPVVAFLRIIMPQDAGYFLNSVHGETDLADFVSSSPIMSVYANG